MNAEIVHYTPGRLRIKIGGARHQTAFFADLQRKLLAVEGVLDVTVNPTAASLVIVHDIGIDPRAICREVPDWRFRWPLLDPRPTRAEGAKPRSYSCWRSFCLFSSPAILLRNWRRSSENRYFARSSTP